MVGTTTYVVTSPIASDVTARPSDNSSDYLYMAFDSTPHTYFSRYLDLMYRIRIDIVLIQAAVVVLLTPPKLAPLQIDSPIFSP